jgi:hypothetical protein
LSIFCRLGYSFFDLGHFVFHLGLLCSFSDNFVVPHYLIEDILLMSPSKWSLSFHYLSFAVLHHITSFHYMSFAAVIYIISSVVQLDSTNMTPLYDDFKS